MKLTPCTDEAVTLCTMEVYTNEYEFAHGHKPRGRGHWMFKIGVEEVQFSNMLYSEAKKEAKKIAKEHPGNPIIKVLS